MQHAKIFKSMLRVLWHLRKEEPDLPHSMMLQLGVHSVHIAGLLILLAIRLVEIKYTLSIRQQV